MIKFYKNGKEFLDDNLEILDRYPLDTSFFKMNSKVINTFNRRNYSFKVIREDKYLLVMRLDDFNLLLFGDKVLIKEAVDVICDYHLFFYGVLASKDLIDEFYVHYINRRGGESFIRHKMDMMYLNELKENPTMSVVKASENDIEKITEYIISFNKEIVTDLPLIFETLLPSI